MLVEEVKMSRSIMQKNYSHCPLKKRPVTIVREERPITPPTPPTPSLPVEVHYDDIDEPENLSTKPEDLSKTGNYPSKASSPAAALAPVDMRHWERRETLVSPPAPPQYLCQTSLEPLNLHTTQEMPTWHKPCPQYPAYLPISYYPEVAYRSPLYADSLSPYAPRDSSCSPPLYVPARHDTHRYMPYSPVDRAALSPASSHASASSYACSSPPLVAAEDLTSPGSVSSDSGISAVSAISKKKKDIGAPRYQCPDCNKSYSTYSGLSKHQQFHCAASEGSLAKKSFSCKYCAKVYTSLGALKMHIRTHTLPCKCHLCGKAFSRPWLLQGHIRTHTGEKPFSCHHCHRAFADRSNLRAHLQTHSEVKKYSCSSCSKTFSRMSLLTKHMEGGCSSPLPPHPHYDYHPEQMQY